MRKLLLSIIAMLYCAFNYAQELPKIIPPTPNASNFHSYGNTEVNHYTGASNVSIPIWNISQGSVSLPINLNYSGGSGIKVAQTASQTGLGWNLNAGGMISRVIRDEADDLPSAYFDTTTIPEIIIDPNGNYLNSDYQTLTSSSYDSEPDKYMINALGLNFTFYIDKNYDVLTLPRNKVEITPVFGTIANSSGDLQGFTVIDEQGLRYEFMEIESQKNTYPGYTDTRYKASSWYLTKVTDPNGNNSVTLFYDEYLYDYQTEITSNYLGNDDLNITNISGQETVNHMYVKGKKLDSIVFNQGKIVFDYSNANERTDVNGEYFVKDIKIKDNSNTLIKGMAFSYGYYSSRLKLNQANFYTDTFTQPSYVFEYDESSTLPTKLSNGIDHWGYYNGASVNQDLEPTRYVEYTAGVNTIQTKWGTGNRNPSTTYKTLGVLTKVTYPTGGHTEFTYENHDCVANKLTGPISTPAYTFSTLQDLEHTITISSLENMPYTPFTLDLDTAITYNSQDYYAVCSVYYGTNLTTTVGYFNFNPDTFGGAPTIAEDTFYGDTAGDYTFIVEFKERYSGTSLYIGSNPDPIPLHWKIKWVEEDTTSTKLVGGIRIKETKDYSEGVLANTTKYTYTNDSGNSSGIMHSVPEYTAYFWDISDLQDTGDLGKGLTRILTPLYALNSKGSHIAYSKIRQEKIDHTNTLNNGYSEYYYSTNTLRFSDDNYYAIIRDAGVDTKSLVGATYTPYPVPVQKDIDFSRGLLEKEIHYDQSGGKIYEKINTYYHNNIPIQSPYYDDGVRIKGVTMMSGSYPKPVYYSLSTGFSLLTSTQEISYANSNSVSKTTLYTYDPMHQSKPITIESINSQGKDTKVENTYLFQLTSPPAPESVLLNTHNNVYALISSTSSADDSNNVEQVLSKQKTVYKNWGSNVVLPELIQTAKGTSSLEDRITFHSYYTNGNVQEVSKKDGTHVVYIWGYNDTQPIAKIENATYADVSSYVSNLQSKSDLDVDAATEQTLRTNLETLRAALPSDALMTSFTYDPLIGVTSITDPRGKTIFYEYDSFNRLEYVKDHDGKILSKNEYNYKN